MFKHGRIYLGRGMQTSGGIYLNIPKSDLGEYKNFNDLKKGSERAKEIFLYKNGFSFVPYSSFKIGIQDRETFLRGGLSRGLEHTSEEIAKNFKEIIPQELSVIVFVEKRGKVPSLETISIQRFKDYTSSNYDSLKNYFTIHIGNSLSHHSDWYAFCVSN